MTNYTFTKSEAIELIRENIGATKKDKVSIGTESLKTMKTIIVDIDCDSHFDMLIDILKQLEKVWWASFGETKEEWTTLLICARENPDLFPMNK